MRRFIAMLYSHAADDDKVNDNAAQHLQQCLPRATGTCGGFRSSSSRRILRRVSVISHGSLHAAMNCMHFRTSLLTFHLILQSLQIGRAHCTMNAKRHFQHIHRVTQHLFQPLNVPCMLRMALDKLVDKECLLIHLDSAVDFRINDTCKTVSTNIATIMPAESAEE